MTGDSLVHDIARATARDIVDVFAGCLREEELHDAFVEVYDRVKASLARFQIQDRRRRQRMRPVVSDPRAEPKESQE
jgi:hypothetical protein